MDSPENWRWIWLVAALVFGVGEMASAGTFFLAPFAIAAVLAAVLAFLDVDLVWQWLAFLVTAGVTFLALRRSPGDSTATTARPTSAPSGGPTVGPPCCRRSPRGGTPSAWSVSIGRSGAARAPTVARIPEGATVRVVVPRAPGWWSSPSRSPDDKPFVHLTEGVVQWSS